MSLLLGHVTLNAQLEFDQDELDFGLVEWRQSATVKVKVTNRGGTPATIKDILTSNCMLKAEWQRQSIPSNQSAVLTFTLEGEMLGHFSASARVRTEDGGESQALKCVAQVYDRNFRQTYQDAKLPSGSSKRTEADKFNYKIGDLELSTDYVDFDDASKGGIIEYNLMLYNGSRKTYAPDLMHLPSYMTFRAEPQSLRPGCVGNVCLALDTREVENYGFKQMSIYLSRYPGDEVGDENEIIVSYFIVPPVDTTRLLQTDMYPRFAIDTTTLVLPSDSTKSKLKGSLTLKNTGKTNLRILSMQVFHPAVNVSLSHSKIKPGGSAKLNVAVLRDYLSKSNRRMRVLMTTNDPKTPKVIVYVALSKEADKTKKASATDKKSGNVKTFSLKDAIGKGASKLKNTFKKVINGTSRK